MFLDSNLIIWALKMILQPSLVIYRRLKVEEFMLPNCGAGEDS